MNFKEIDLLNNLNELYQNGAVTEEEFAVIQKRISRSMGEEEESANDHGNVEDNCYGASKSEPTSSGSTTDDTSAPEAAEESGHQKSGDQDTVLFSVSEQSQAALMHLSVILGIFFPVGFLVPFVMWLIFKNTSDYINTQGKIILNWVFSFSIYLLCASLLIILLVGFVLVPVLFILNTVFAVAGAINAKAGKVRSYPLSIRFFFIEK